MTMQPLIKYETVGRRLTTSEVDGNWEKLEAAVASLEAGGLSIVGITLAEDASGARLVFIGSDGSIVAEVAFPAAIMSAGEWTAGAAYTTRDLATHNGGTYLCIVAHTAGADFDGDVLTGKWIQLGAGAAAGLSFDGGPYGLEATTMQDAIVEVNSKIAATNPTAANVSFDNSGGELEATNVQAALVEIIEHVGALPAGEIAFTPVTGTAATDVQAAIADAFEAIAAIDTGGGGGGEVAAADVSFTGSGLTSTNVQAAILEVKGLIPADTDNQTAAEVTYDHATSGLAATNVQAAIDELKTMVGEGGSGGGASDAAEVDFDGSSTNYLTTKTNVQDAVVAVDQKIRGILGSTGFVTAESVKDAPGGDTVYGAISVLQGKFTNLKSTQVKHTQTGTSYATVDDALADLLSKINALTTRVTALESA